MRKALACATLLAFFAVAYPSAGFAAARTVSLNVGSRGDQVAKLEYLLRAPRPRQNVFVKVKGTYTGKIDGRYGWQLADAVRAYKFRIGYPGAGQCGAKIRLFAQTQVTAYLFDLLQGRKNRPLCWVALAQHRTNLFQPGVTDLAWQIKQLETTQIGVVEQPLGSNRGPIVDKYERYFGLLGEPWCAIFQSYEWAHVPGAPEFAPPPFNRFYVPSIGEWAQQHGYLNAKAKVGSLVAFLSGPNVLDGYHIGYVVKLVGGSGYVTIEGNNASGVREVYHPFGDALRVFIDVPGVA